ncbi:Uncharacterised protein [Mycobacteroides abscessus subsp. abscessus]|nr:Uncharacterised protein [Mycobacteroides abscessus subsp. abscessus]
MAAVKAPLVMSAMNTATNPEIAAPMIGMNAPRNTSDARGSASGTLKAARPTPIPMASTSATATVART